MLNDEQINEIAKDCYYGHDTHEGDISRAIKEALELNDKSKWKYPEKGELPEEHRDILFIYKKYRTMNHGYYFNNHWFLYENSSGAVTDAIKRWTYAPTMED